jgi:hypothetical protein
MEKNDISYNIFLALMIFITNMFDRNIVFASIKENFKIFSEKNQDISKYILSFSLFFSFTKNLQISIIGMILVALFELSNKNLKSSAVSSQEPIRYL